MSDVGEKQLRRSVQGPMLGAVRLVLESGVNKHGAEELSSFCFHTLTCRQRQTYTLKPSETRAHAFIGLIDGRNHLLVTHDVAHVQARPFRGANEQQTDSGCHYLLCGNTDTAQTHRLFPVCFFMAPENTPGEVGEVGGGCLCPEPQGSTAHP